MPAPVVALTILDGDTLERDGLPTSDSLVLVVVRAPETNATHPNVLCVPTQRIPMSAAERLLAHPRQVLMSNAPSLHYYGEQWHDSAQARQAPEVIFLVNSLLCRKLGLADALERGEFFYKASLHLSIEDEVFHPDHSELTIMFNIVLKVERGIQLIPGSSASYRRIGWCPVEKFVTMTETRNPTIFDNTLSPLQICVQGLCIKSSLMALYHQVGSIAQNAEMSRPQG